MSLFFAWSFNYNQGIDMQKLLVCSLKKTKFWVSIHNTDLEVYHDPNAHPKTFQPPYIILNVPYTTAMLNMRGLSDMANAGSQRGIDNLSSSGLKATYPLPQSNFNTSYTTS
jgi:hypothetical protein